MKDDFDEFTCVNMDDGRLVFEPRGTLTNEELERADLHVGYCPSCQADMDFDFLMNRLGENNSRSEIGNDSSANGRITNQTSRSDLDSSSISQVSLPFDFPNDPPTIQKKKSVVIRLGNPAIPVKVGEYGTYVAKLDHVWRAARTYAKRNNYKVLELYGVIGVAPFCEERVGVWLNYLEIPHRPPVEVYQLYDKDVTWLAEWSIE